MQVYFIPPSTRAVQSVHAYGNELTCRNPVAYRVYATERDTHELYLVPAQAKRERSRREEQDGDDEEKKKKRHVYKPTHPPTQQYQRRNRKRLLRCGALYACSVPYCCSVALISKNPEWSGMRDARNERDDKALGSIKKRTH